MKNHKIIDILVADGIDRAIAYYGIEGTEEVIKRAYKLMPEIQKKLLKELKRRLK